MMRDEDVRQKTLPRPKQSRKHSQLRAAWRHLDPSGPDSGFGIDLSPGPGSCSPALLHSAKDEQVASNSRCWVLICEGALIRKGMLPESDSPVD